MDPVLKRFLQGYAVVHHTTTAKLVREVLAEWMYDRVSLTPSERVSHTLRRLDLLSKQLQLKLAVLPAVGSMPGSEGGVRIAGTVRISGHEAVEHEEEKEPPRPRGVDTVKERESMYWIVVGMLKEAQELSENEALAEKAGSRMDAMKAASALSRAGETILAGYDRAYIQPHLDELEKLIEQLKEQLKQTDQKGQENTSGSTET
jgi:hypothetical protein